MSERLGEVLLAERQLSGGPDLGVLRQLLVVVKELRITGTYRLEVLLNLGVEGTSLQGNDLRSGIGVVGDGRTALAAEETVDDVAG